MFISLFCLDRYLSANQQQIHVRVSSMCDCFIVRTSSRFMSECLQCATVLLCELVADSCQTVFNVRLFYCANQQQIHVRVSSMCDCFIVRTSSRVMSECLQCATVLLCELVADSCQSVFNVRLFYCANQQQIRVRVSSMCDCFIVRTSSRFMSECLRCATVLLCELVADSCQSVFNVRLFYCNLQWFQTSIKCFSVLIYPYKPHHLVSCYDRLQHLVSLTTENIKRNLVSTQYGGVL